MAYGACAMDANPKVGLPSSSLLYRVDSWRERYIDEEGAPALTYIVNCTYMTTIAQMSRAGCVCGKTDVSVQSLLRDGGRHLGSRRLDHAGTETPSGNVGTVGPVSRAIGTNGLLIGYARVSSDGQALDLPRDA